MPTSPHDAIFKASFGQPDIARSELELVLPPAVLVHLDMATLEVLPGSFLDEDLRLTHSDLLYAVRTRAGQEARVLVVFEHQSSPDATMPFRLLRYMVGVWSRWLRDHPTSKTLPIVLPILLHHGPKGWKATPEFASMLDASPELLVAVRPFQPQFRFLVDDLAVLSLEALATRALHALGRMVQLAFWSSRSIERLKDAAPLMRVIAATVTRDTRTRELLTQLYVYLLQAAQPDVDADAVRTILLDVAGPQGREDVVNAAEQLIEQGRAEGLERGRAQGLRSALEATLVARGLALSEAGRARLASCDDLAVLTTWVTRSATAATEADVFGVETT
jgi:predicted transposase/invertase (TIGR01784 family)